MEKSKYPNILVISNNAFSSTNNNGKTLASFFHTYPPEKMSQIYFNREIPTDDYFENYFRITDNDIVKASLRIRKICGQQVFPESSDRVENNRADFTSQFISKTKHFNITRLIREVFWKSNRWKTEAFHEFLERSSPDIIFFTAGDSLFAYDIFNYVKKKYEAKTVVYITDDYILPRKTLSPFWKIRRKLVFNKMKDAIENSDLFITISSKMQKTYKKIFNKDSILAMNMSEKLGQSNPKASDSNKITFIYAGGLHYNRYKTLHLLAQALKKHNNNSTDKKAFLEIYSTNPPEQSIKNLLNINGVSKFCGSLNQNELKDKLNLTDIPVHVESFDQKSIESTRLSISTKIPEYLSLAKPVLAIGPRNVASMEYLSGTAFCITDQEEIYKQVVELINNKELQIELARSAIEKYEQNHQKDVTVNNLINEILGVCKNTSVA